MYPRVAVWKSNKLTDSRVSTTTLIRERQPIPTVEETVHEMVEEFITMTILPWHADRWSYVRSHITTTLCNKHGDMDVCDPGGRGNPPSTKTSY